MRIGILGGTFDPIHIAHLIIAEEARASLSLEEVVFIPAGEPWLKKENPVSSGELRLQMVRLAVAPHPFFRAASVEIDREGPTYTVDTLDALRHEWGLETEVYFILGGDALADLPQWKEPERFLQQCSPVVFARPERTEPMLRELESVLPGLREKVQLLEGPQMQISSTVIRERVARGISIRYLVPPSVEQFIAERGLYDDKKGK